MYDFHFQIKFRQISSYFANSFDITSKRGHYKFNEVLDEVFIVGYSNFNPDIVASLSDSS